MIKRKFIACDLDAVLANTPKAVNKWVYDLYGLGPGDTPNSGIYENVESTPGMDFSKLEAIFMRQDFWSSIKPFNGAKEFTQQLCSWASISIITDRRWYESLESETGLYLRDNDLEHDYLSICKGKEKGLYCRDNNIDIAIEDNLKNAILISEYCPCILMAWPYNMKYEQVNQIVESKNIYIAASYQEAITIIGVILKLTPDSVKYPQSTKYLFEQ